ncbi:unnamed protein product [Prorocentrum cordatum]|uniref:Uncharacterized protein n=1 Tax=Prorocentrum cordatum TaxID=2364126 RepID=A0ABN9SSM5_9DINO|nr:unnamed protein product [Polarella glacialis]
MQVPSAAAPGAAPARPEWLCQKAPPDARQRPAELREIADLVAREISSASTGSGVVSGACSSAGPDRSDAEEGLALWEPWPVGAAALAGLPLEEGFAPLEPWPLGPAGLAQRLGLEVDGGSRVAGDDDCSDSAAWEPWRALAEQEVSADASEMARWRERRARRKANRGALVGVGWRSFRSQSHEHSVLCSSDCRVGAGVRAAWHSL